MSEGMLFIFNLMQVLESSDMPPLPVSSIKFRESEKSSRRAFITTTPPVKLVKGKLLTKREGGGMNSSCACMLVAENKNKERPPHKNDKFLGWKKLRKDNSMFLG